MPAATENTKPSVDYWGATPVVVIDVTWGNGDTYAAVDLGAVEAAIFVPTTNASYGLTISGKTVTLVSGGSLTGKLILFGDAS